MTLTTRQFYKKCSPITITDGKGNIKKIIKPADATKGKQHLRKILGFLQNCRIEFVENYKIDKYKATIFLPEYQFAIKTFTPIPRMFKSKAADERREKRKIQRKEIRKLIETKYQIKFIYLNMNSNYKSIKEFIVKQLSKFHKQGICKEKWKQINSVMFSEHLEYIRKIKAEKT